MCTPAPGAHPVSKADIADSKALLRARMVAQREAMTSADRTSQNTERNTWMSQALLGIESVAMYLSRAAEPDTVALARRLQTHGTAVWVPLLTNSSLDRPRWAPFDGQLREGRFGIPEPVLSTDFEIASRPVVDIMVCSALAATNRGDRLGVGGGWFDRVLADTDATVWAMLFDGEVLEELPTAGHDRRVHALALPSGLVECG